MAAIKKLAGQTAIYGLSSLVGRFLNYLLTPFYTWLIFKPHEFGVVTELYAYVVYLLIFLTYGMETGYFRFMQDESNKKYVYPTILISVFTTSAVFIFLSFWLVTPVARFLRYEDFPNYIQILAVVVAIDAFTAIPFAKLRQENKALRFALLKIVNISINIGCNVVFLLVFPFFARKYNISFISEYFIVDNMVVYVFISNLIASICTFLLLLPEIFSESFRFNFSLLKKILPYSFPLLLAGLAGQTNEILDRLLLKHFLTIPEMISDKNKFILGQIGIYGANYKIAVIITLFIQSFRYAFEPMFFSHSKNFDSKQTYADIMKYFIIFCLFLFLLITLFIDFFKYFIGVDYHVGLHIVPIVLLANIFLGILFNLSLWYKLTDRTRYGLLIASFGAIITIVFNILLIPRIGFVGSAWTHLICYSSMVILSFVLMRRYFPITYDLKRIFIYFVLAIGLYYLHINISISNVVLKYVINSIFLLCFIIFVVYKEKLFKELKKYARKNC